MTRYLPHPPRLRRLRTTVSSIPSGAPTVIASVLALVVIGPPLVGAVTAHIAAPGVVEAGARTAATGLRGATDAPPTPLRQRAIAIRTIASRSTDRGPDVKGSTAGPPQRRDAAPSSRASAHAATDDRCPDRGAGHGRAGADHPGHEAGVGGDRRSDRRSGRGSDRGVERGRSRGKSRCDP